jgi:cysteine desulfurase
MAYLDHAATTSVLPEVIEAMTHELATVGNPSSLHTSGRHARMVVEIAREQIADALRCLPNEVIFTAGGTEADNLAIKGMFWARHNADSRRVRILASSIEHHAVLDPVQWLGDTEQAVVEWIPVDSLGRIGIDALNASIEKDPESVALISVMWANNEIGTVQPIEEVVAIAKAHGIPVHTDAVQAIGNLPVSFHDSGVDAMTISGHKIGGPMGIGALLLKREYKPVPVLHGGGQEREVRSGTLPTHLIAALGVAVASAVKHQAEHAQHVSLLRDHLIAGIKNEIPDAILNGDHVNRLPGNAHFSFPGCEGDALLMLFDAAGVECSTGSACTAGIPQPSHVLLAMGVSKETAVGSLRFSLGRTSTQADVDAVVASVSAVVARARRAGKTVKV